jgi:tetratricopeptide (TPR) repeat protein
VIPPRPKSVLFLAALAGLLSLSRSSSRAHAQQLGSLTFPNSGAAAAQVPFIRGVLYLHSFEYPSALHAFRDAQRLDPGFAMAYWGEAMTWTHPVWNEQDLDSARATLRRLGPTPDARRARAPTPREQAWLGAMEALYGEGGKAWRDTAYARVMERLAAAYPEDDEAQLFYALALLGLSQGKRDVPTYMRAGAIALDVFARHPDHPGAAHYVIHAFDDPVHAPIGLKAARAYGPIAPDASHAQHMTSHIFLAMGLWDDVVRVNENAVRMTSERRAHAGGHSSGCGHYPEWLAYGYQQQGRMKDAARIVEGCWKSATMEGGDGIEGLAGMRAAYLVDSRDWSGRFVEEPEGQSPGGVAYLAFGTGYAAAMRGDRKVLTGALERLEAANQRMDGDFRPYGKMLALELTALVRALSRDSVAAVAMVRQAAGLDDALPMPFGPPWTIKPPHELLGELLLGMGRAEEARREFEAALARTPRRPLTVLGLMRSQEAVGRSAEAETSRALLKALWRQADPGLPGVP